MPKQRCHFSMFITKTIKGMWGVLTAIFIFLFQSGNDGLVNEASGYRLWIFIVLLTILLVTLIFNFVRWRKTFVYLDDDSLVVDRRTINRKKTTVKLSTIASVNIKKGILEKPFGTYRLQLDINSSATAERTDFDLVFKRERAQEIRNLLLNKDAVSDAGPTEEKQEAGESICSFDLPQVIRHCILSIPVPSIFAASVGFIIWYFSLNFGVDGSVSWIPIIIVVFPAIFQFVRPFFLYNNFKVQKAGSNLEISYGFISHQHFSLPLDKTNAIIIRRPALARIFGLCSGEIINIGMGDRENNQAPLFCLLVPPDKMYDIVLAIAPEYAEALQTGDKKPLQRSPKSALLPTLISWGIGGIVGLTAAIIAGYWWIGALIMLALLVSGFFHWSTKELALLDNKISISTGIFNKRNITADYAKLQKMVLRHGPVSRHLGLARGNVNILSSMVNRHNRIGYFPKELFEKISARIMLSTKVKDI